MKQFLQWHTSNHFCLPGFMRWNIFLLLRSVISSVATKLAGDLHFCVGVQTADSSKYLNKYRSGLFVQF